LSLRGKIYSKILFELYANLCVLFGKI